MKDIFYALKSKNIQIDIIKHLDKKSIKLENIDKTTFISFVLLNSNAAANGIYLKFKLENGELILAYSLDEEPYRLTQKRLDIERKFGVDTPSNIRKLLCDFVLKTYKEEVK